MEKKVLTIEEVLARQVEEILPSRKGLEALMKKKKIRFRTIGTVEDLSPQVQEKIRRNVAQTQPYSDLVLTLALSYSSRVEILEAAKRLCREVAAGELEVDQIDEACFEQHLDTAGIPDPDLLIRTSGELRISNFLLWQISYTELYVSDKYWPEFRRDDFLEAVRQYQKRERRFGHTEARAAAR